MIQKQPLNPARLRKINGSFAFIEHRFRYFIKTLTHQELLLYLFLVLAADKQGLSYYSTDTICACLKISLRQYLKVWQASQYSCQRSFKVTPFRINSRSIYP
jgi:hypothetical protein